MGASLQNWSKLDENTKHIDLSWGYITKKLRELFSNGSLRLLLYVLGKFVQTAMKSTYFLLIFFELL